MKNLIIIVIMALAIAGCSSVKKNGESEKNANQVALNSTTQTFYDFSALNMQGKEIKLSDYKGKIVLVVNTASKCGFTPQFAGLEELYKKYSSRGFVVLGFPSNQFANQDPGSNEEILEFCKANYGVTFPMFEKIDVNGENAHPVYTYLKNSVPNAEPEKIKWNFTKFLIGKDGKTLKRYESRVKPADIEADIQELLK
ncbi:MAG TPA: glutathione peroxidase [Paludibacteraceae bacterium]|nr:glutathione peroxidase [Paludibacteraceae bacterium]